MQRYVAQQPPSSYSAVLAKCVRRLIPPDFLLRYPYARRGAPSVTHTLDFVVRHGYVLLFFWILAEQGALPLPSAPLLLACGALAKDGRLAPHWIVLTGVAACLIADNFWFMLGRRRGARVLHFICRVALEPDSCVRQTETAYQRYGSRFILFHTLVALIWISSVAGVGYIFSGQLDKAGDYAARMGSSVAVLAVGLLAAWIGWKFAQRRRFLKKLAVARITAAELKVKLKAGEEIVVVGVRTALASEVDSVPGALRIPLEDLETRHDEIPRDRDIILFCS